MSKTSMTVTFRNLIVVTCLIVAGMYVYGRIEASRTEISVEQIQTQLSAGKAGSFTVAAYNIAHGRGAEKGTSNWSGDGVEKAEKAKAIGRFLAESGIDIVVLNEVDFDASWSGRQDQASLIAETGDFPFIARQINFNLALPGFSLKFGNALLSRFPIIHAERVPLPAYSQPEALFFGNHDAIRATIAIDSTSELDLWGLHLEVRDQATRVSAVERIVDQLNESRPIILAGDLNSEFSESPSAETALETLLRSNLIETPPVACEPSGTFPSMAPKRSLDWIVHSSLLERVECGVVAIELSDHLPVVSRFRIRELAVPTFAP